MQAPEVLGGRYELRGVLGRGGMAEVRDGWDIRLGRPVAIKLLHPLFSTDPDNRRRFEVEARAVAVLNHPHIVCVHDSGEHNGTPYIVMERLSERTLADAIAAGPMPQRTVRTILDDVLSALAAAHAAGILHRDIKPANILFTDLGETKVADFGIAKSGDAVLTLTGRVFGTMAYLSAERIAGRPASAADDLYALGVVGYEALTGRRPYPQENLPELARAIAQDTPPSLTMLRPDVDPALAAVVERAMARDPQWRFGSAAEMRGALAGRGSPVGTRPPTMVLATPLPDPTTMVVPPQVRRSRSRMLLGLAAALAAIVIAVAAFIADTASRAPVPEPASTSTSVPTALTTSLAAPPPPPTTTPVEQPNPKKGGGNGNGNGHKPKHGD